MGEEKSLCDNIQYLMFLFRDVRKFDHLQSEKDNLKDQIAYSKAQIVGDVWDRKN